jgi:hypothetical protein
MSEPQTVEEGIGRDLTAFRRGDDSGATDTVLEAAPVV